jgi:hypothetical protein
LERIRIVRAIIVFLVGVYCANLYNLCVHQASHDHALTTLDHSITMSNVQVQ